MDFCGCGEDIALKQMFSEEEQATFSATADGKAIPVMFRPMSSKSYTENRQEEVVVETVESDGTMERQMVFNPKGRDSPAPEPTGTQSEEEETESSGPQVTKIENKKNSKNPFKMLKLKKRSKKQ